MMRKDLILSLGILAYVNILPYASRIGGGITSVAQYLPDKGHFIFGLFFMGFFASLPAIPLILGLSLRKRIPITFAVSVIMATLMLWFWHHDYDLVSDAQAAVGLVFIPIYVAVITIVILVILGLIEVGVRKGLTAYRKGKSINLQNP